MHRRREPPSGLAGEAAEEEEDLAGEAAGAAAGQDLAGEVVEIGGCSIRSQGAAKGKPEPLSGYTNSLRPSFFFQRLRLQR